MPIKRTDANQKEIVEKLRSLGFSVWSTHVIGKGFPDLVVGKYAMNFLIEVKDGAKPPSSQRLTEDELVFHRSWKGHVCILASPLDCDVFSKWVDDRASGHR